ncbi:hypothetical protein L1049_022391 [Liquidambar formosana]|uniref:Uncharacterized protein n=1 Tax=Liquidambar formosana TaxID=63359 RepID=A0AAP0RDS2_LIQFO
MGHSCSLTNFTQSSPFTLVMHHGRMPSLSTNTSHIKNQLQPAGAEAQGILSSKPNFQLEQVFSESTTFVDNLAAEAPCNSTWSREGSTLTSFEQRLPSEMGVQSSPYVFPAKPNTHVSCNDTVQSFQDSTFTSLFNTGGLLDMKKNIEYSSGKLMDNQNPATLFHATECELLECSTSLQTFQEDFKPAELTAAALSKSYPLDDVSQWFAPSPEHRINGLSTTLNDDLSQEIGVTSVPSRLDGGGVFIDIPVEHPASSLRSSTTNIFNSDGKAKALNVPGAENDMFDCLELDFGCRQVGESWEDILMPVVSVVTRLLVLVYRNACQSWMLVPWLPPGKGCSQN